jgi:hypothetical protein
LLCEHVFVRTGRAFQDRLLELLPIDSDTGRRLAALDPTGRGAGDEVLAWTVADRACRCWLRGAIAPSVEVLDACVFGLEHMDEITDPSTAMEAVELVRDTRDHRAVSR